MPQTDWQALLFDPSTRLLQQLEHLAKRRFQHSETVAQEAFNFALEAISANEFAQLTGNYAGRSQPRTYLITVWSRLLEDYARKVYGRYRPPAALQGNSLLVRIHKWLCQEGQPSAVVIDRLRATGDGDDAYIEQAIREVRARDPHCGKAIREVAIEDEADAPAPSAEHAADVDVSAEANLARAPLTAVLSALRVVLADASAVGLTAEQLAVHWPALADDPQALTRKLALSDEDRVLLRMVYVDGHTISMAARLLKRRDHELRRRVKRLLAQLRATLEEAGLTIDALPLEELRAAADQD